MVLKKIFEIKMCDLFSFVLFQDHVDFVLFIGIVELLYSLKKKKTHKHMCIRVRVHAFVYTSVHSGECVCMFVII